MHKHLRNSESKVLVPRKLRSGDSLWSELAGQPPDFSPLRDDIHCEVLVLGAGITGALIAQKLAKAGIDVVLLDEHEVGRGSTAASTGLLQYEIDTPLVELISRVGETEAVHAYRRGLTAIDEIEGLIEDMGQDCGFERRSSLYYCSRAAHLRDLQLEYECRRHFGFDVSWLSRQQLAAEFLLDAPAAIVSRGDAQMDPLRFTWALVQAAKDDGARIYANTPVKQVEEFETRVVAQVKEGRVHANKVVYATGYHTAKHLHHPVGSLHSTYAVASQPGLELSDWPVESLLWETNRPYLYARRTEDGRVIIGGEDTEFADDHDRDALFDRQVERLVDRFRKLFPSTPFVPEFAWAGTFGETEDGLAYIGQVANRPSAYFAMGYGGNGITFSVIAARLITDLYRGHPNLDAAVFRFGR